MFKAKNIKKLIIFVSLVFAVLIAGNFAYAQDANSLFFGGRQGTVGSILGLGSEDPRIIAASIIRVVLGFLGILAVGLIMYAGFLWMTADGEADKIDKAKKILIGAAIGLVLILSSFAIATYVLDKIYQATGGGSGVPSTCGAPPTCDAGETCNNCPGDCGPCPVAVKNFYPVSTSPATGAINIPQNAKIRFTFNTGVDSSTVKDTTFTITNSSGAAILGNRSTNGSRITFSANDPLYACPANSCGATNCLPATDLITVTVLNGAGGILSVGSSPLQLSCVLGIPCSFTFTTGNYVDCQNPTVKIKNDQFCAVVDNELFASGSDDSAIDRIDFSIDGSSAALTGNPVFNTLGVDPFDSSTEGPVIWDASAIATGTSVTIGADAYDLADNTGKDTQKVIVRAATCCNGIQDGTETGIDCGGICGACNNGQCDAGDSDPATCVTADDTLCASNYCDDLTCLCQSLPTITWVSPNDGAVDNFITIGGQNFGTTPGKVYFSGAAGDIEALYPNTVNPLCTNSWQDDQIIVVVPVGAIDGPIKVETSALLQDTTDNANGPSITDFDVNSIKRPGLCLVLPANQGYFNDSFTLQGTAFSGTVRSVEFGNNIASTTANNIGVWANTNVSASVPNLKAGQTSIFVAVDGENSNPLGFKILVDTTKMPIIDYIDPDTGPPGQYVTIYGSNFKSYDPSASKVTFTSEVSSVAYLADGLDFPEECRDGWWRDKYIIVKVPPGIQTAADFGKYEVTVTNKDTFTSQPENFDVINDTPGPGLCKLYPYNGKVGRSVIAYGDNFGNVVGSGFVEFFNNKSSIITTWGNQKIDTSVPAGAETGPVFVSDGSKQSNRLPFTVGDCAADSDCDTVAGDQCCSSGTFWSGICRPAGTCNAGAPTACEYAWTFTTGPDPAPPATCSGYTKASACLAAGSCPSSPGQCQTSTSRVVGSGCASSDCNADFSQCAGACSYDPALNRCKNAGICDSTDSTLIAGYTAECRKIGSAGLWQINNNGASCPAGSYLDANGWCTVGAIGAPSGCNICVDGFSCSATKECVINQQICPKNSTCDLIVGSPTINECVNDNDICECCCQSSADCCLGLTCTPGGCGTGAPYGFCTGCAVDLNGNGIVEAGTEQTASDAACNCSGTSGKFCDLTDLVTYPTGFCNDTGGVGAPCNDGGACSSGSACAPGLFCDPSAACTCQLAGGPGSSCDSDSTTPICDPLDAMCGIGLVCNTSTCLCGSPPGTGGSGTDCILASAAPACSVGTSSCIVDTACRIDSTSANCRCCCDPSIPQVNAAGLECVADKAPCDTAARGLYCGCSTDTQCGYPTIDGCSSIDTCCRERPNVTAVSPLDGAVNICRNTMITATFDKAMNVASFSGNVIVLGDYGATICPKGTQYLIGKAMEENKGFFARIISKTLGLLKKILGPIMPGVWAQATNYCAITGTVGGYQNSDGSTTLTFSPKDLLAPNQKYYVVIKGDSDALDSKQEGVESIYGVSMYDATSQTFNAVNYSGTIWSFTTMPLQAPNSGICKISQVEVTPSSYLFQTTANDMNEDDTSPAAPSFDTVKDKDKVFVSKALTIDGQQLAEIAGIYEWTWSWANTNNTVVQFKPPYAAGDLDKRFVEAQPGVTDGSSIITATADVSGSAESGTEFYSGQANVWVFVCSNPWPAVDPVTGNWQPWSDSRLGCSDGSGLCSLGAGLGTPCGTGAGTCVQNCLPASGVCYDFYQEFYYCRDAAGTGTADDLPAILNNAVIRGSSTVDNLLKEYYFFRETSPTAVGLGLTVVNQTVDSADGEVMASWAADPTAAGYKVYFGTESGNYSGFRKIPGSAITSIVIGGLTVGQTYYFTITSYYNTGAESAYAGEVVVDVTDAAPPSAPSGISLNKACDGAADISWTANTDDAVGYRVYYGVSSGSYGGSQDVKSATNITLAGLANGSTYYMVVKAYDAFGNESSSSAQLNFIVSSGCIDDDLISYWPFESVAGGITPDIVGNNDGTLMGGASLNSSGQVGSAMSFDGIDDYVGVADDDSLDVTTTFSISMWFKRSLLNKNQDLYSKNGPQTDGALTLGISPVGNLYAVVQLRAVILTTSTRITDQNWHHVVLTRDSNNFWIIYLDGIESVKVQDNDPTHIPVANTAGLSFGGEFPPTTTPPLEWPFTGSIDEVKIYSVALTAADIQNQYNQALAASINSARVSQWSFNEGMGSVANDSVGNNDGTLYGGTTWNSSGRVGSSVDFNGQVGSYIDCGNDPSLTLQDEISIAYWYKRYGGNVFSYTEDKISKRANYMVVGQNGSNLVANIGPTVDAYLTPTAQIVDGVWVHQVHTYNAATGIGRSYQNGVLVGQNVYSIGSPPYRPNATTNRLTISEGTSYMLNGSIDEVIIFNKELSGAEANLLFKSYP